jgi:DHA1 family multidrug resistance protein-like MFS transporter
MIDRITAWLARWGAILPLLFAEAVLWLGIGALLPVLPIYFEERGISPAMLGIVIAAFPAAKLVSEPLFGWVADRVPRVPLLVIGLLVFGIIGALPLWLTDPLWFLVLRAGTGLGAAIYDPAARGFLTDATPSDRQGEAFGLYGAAQMGGLLVGPAIGAIGAAWFGGIAFVFIFFAVTSVLAAVAIALRIREGPRRGSPLSGRVEVDGVAPDQLGGGDRPVLRLANRGLIAAIVLNAGSSFGAGTYEVVWSLFLKGLGADLPLIGLTFAMFGLPVLLLSPVAGRLVDQRGPLPFLVLGSILPAITGILYTLMTDPVVAVPLILVEATGFALLSPALYAVVAANSPPTRTSTAQGWYGAAGTLGYIVASLATGFLMERSILYPFYAFAAGITISLVVALLIGRTRLRDLDRAGPDAALAAAP